MSAALDMPPPELEREALDTPAHQSWADVLSANGEPVRVVWDGAFGPSPEAWMREHMSVRGFYVGRGEPDLTSGRVSAPVQRKNQP